MGRVCYGWHTSRSIPGRRILRADFLCLIDGAVHWFGRYTGSTGVGNDDIARGLVSHRVFSAECKNQVGATRKTIRLINHARPMSRRFDAKLRIRGNVSLHDEVVCVDFAISILIYKRQQPGVPPRELFWIAAVAAIVAGAYDYFVATRNGNGACQV